MAFVDGLTARISEAIRDPEMMPAALMSTGVPLTAAALALIVFKAPGGIFLRLQGGGAAAYYGFLIFAVIYGLAVLSVGFWLVPRDTVGWHAAGKKLLWGSVLLLILVAALGGLAFLK